MSKEKKRLILLAFENYEARMEQIYEDMVFELEIRLHLKEETVRRELEKL